MPAEQEDGAQGAAEPQEAEAGAAPGAAAADERKRPAAGGAKKVTIRKSVADRIKLFNVSGELKQEVRLAVVALALSKLDEQAALDVLDELLEASDDIEDPNSFVCKRAREVAKEKAAEEAARIAAEEAEEGAWEEDGNELGEAGEEAPKRKKRKKAKAEDDEGAEEDDTPEAAVKRRVKVLNEGETLWEPIRFKRLEALLPMVGVEEFGRILDRMEKKAEDLANPTAWVRREVMKKLGPVLSRCDQLNRSVPGKMDLLAAIELAKVREPLATLPESTAFRILKELEDNTLEIKDPTAWIIEEAKKRAPSGPLVDHIRKLNASGRLQQQIDLTRALDVLSALDQQKATGILTSLGIRAAKIRNPVGWMAAEVRMRQQLVAAGPAAKGGKPGAAAAKEGKPAAKAAGPAPSKQLPQANSAAAGKGSAVKRPRTAEAAAASAKSQAAVEAPVTVANGSVSADADEEPWDDDAGEGEAEEALELEEACLFGGDDDGEDPDAIG